MLKTQREEKSSFIDDRSLENPYQEVFCPLVQKSNKTILYQDFSETFQNGILIIICVTSEIF